MNNEVKSAARMLDLIEYLSNCAEPVRLKDIVASLGFPKSSAHALVQTLVARGYAIQDHAERYILVHTSRYRSSTRANEARLVAAAHPVMELLRDDSGETVVLAVRTTKGEPKRLAKCVSRQAVRYDIDLDTLGDAYCTATGRLLLAHWERQHVDAYLERVSLIAMTDRTVTDRDAIRSLLVTIRESGISICDQEHVWGSTGLAAPVRDRTGAVVAALNMGVISTRYYPRRDELIAMLLDAAFRISARLGLRRVQSEKP
jgi:IclR family pca regulon transcriptional regulator